MSYDVTITLKDISAYNVEQILKDVTNYEYETISINPHTEGVPLRPFGIEA